MDVSVRIEMISSVKSFGVERRESLESVSKEAYDATVREREAFRVRVQQLEERLRIAVNEKNTATRSRDAAIRDRDAALRELDAAKASLNHHKD